MIGRLLAMAGLLIAAGSSAQPLPGADPGLRADARLDPQRPVAAELRTTVRDGFTLAVVGDLIMTRPLASAPEAASVLALVRASDAAFGNLETPLLDIRGFTGAPYPFDGDWANIGVPGVAADLKAMGFDLLGRANNHALDWGLEGMRETGALLDAAGLVHAGVGESAGAARAPRYFDSPKGRVALVSFATTFRPTSEAMPPRGQAPGRAGLSALHLARTVHLAPPAFAALAAADCAANRRSCDAQPDRLGFEGVAFRRDDRSYDAYDPDPLDWTEIARAIREARQHADFVIVAIHAHECARDCATTDRPQLPAEILKDIAHAAVDAGADLFAASGIHNLGPVEIYRDRPIFYGLGNFVWSDIVEPVPYELFQLNRALLGATWQHPERATDYDLTAPLNATSFANAFTFQSVLAQVRFDRGRLAELRLYPVSLGYGDDLRRSGTPRREVDPARAGAILHAIEERTRAYGLPALPIAMEGGAGVIRLR